MTRCIVADECKLDQFGRTLSWLRKHTHRQRNQDQREKGHVGEVARGATHVAGKIPSGVLQFKRFLELSNSDTAVDMKFKIIWRLLKSLQ